MPVIELTRGYVTFVDQEDYTRVMAAGSWFPNIPSNRKTIYVTRNIKKGTIGPRRLHRFILGITDPKILVDHRDGNGLNNKRSNLRKATPSQSQCNRGKHSNNTTGYTGVGWNKNANKYEAHITLKGKKKHLGLFVKIEDAAKAAEDARKKYHKDFSIDVRP